MASTEPAPPETSPFDPPIQLLDPSGKLTLDDRLPLDLATVDLAALHRD
ncbi:hypothetical protein ACRAWF_22340 [Streptomyces sp. L7]